MKQSRHYEPLPSPSVAIGAMVKFIMRKYRKAPPKKSRKWPEMNRDHVRLVLDIIKSHGGSATFTHIREDFQTKIDLPGMKLLELVRRIATAGMVRLDGVATLRMDEAWD